MIDASTASRQRGVRVLGVGFGVVFVLLCVVALVGYLGVQGVPSYYTDQLNRISAMSDQEREAISKNFEAGIANGWTDAGPSMPKTEADLYGHRRTIEIPYDELNVWLADQGTAMLQQIGISLPDSVKGAMVDSAGEGLLRISCDVERGQRRQLVSMTFAVAVSEDGVVTSTLEGARAGRLPVPTAVARDMIAQRGDGGGLMVGLTRGEPVGPVQLPIDKARDGRLIGLQIEQDKLVVTRETVRPK
ncbi:MAG: hypothetical protein ACE37H_11175 [Phycisphaeraceae bacterium]